MKADATTSDGCQVHSTLTGAPVIDVLYVGGADRSRSTVVALLLAQLPGFVAVGGVVSLWERGLKENYSVAAVLPFDPATSGSAPMRRPSAIGRR